MGNRYIKDLLLVLCGVFLLVTMYSCANMASPNGGPYDETPPKFISSLPAPNQTNYKGKKVEILFDELVQLDKPSENVIITPPQMQLPVIRAAGKKVVVELKDTLKENTTYTIDFTNSISDNNEKNVFENFSFAFSTGDVIDTLEVSGILLNAENLEPMPGITIGLHKNGEEIAFNDSIIIPSLELTTRQDTLWKDSLTIDTIRTVAYTRYFPDDIELRLFKENFVRQYLLKPERQQENLLTIRFNAPLDTVPLPKPLNFTPENPDWFFTQETEAGKGVNFWLTDSLVWKQDTLQVELSYPKSDSLNVLRPQTDTLQFVMRRRPEKKKKKKDDEPEPIVFLGMQIDAPGSMDLFDTVSVTFNEPILELPKEVFYLDQKVDTVWTPVDFELFPDSTNSLNYFIRRPWKYAEEYRLSVDSATIFSLYGKWNEPYSAEFKIKKEDEYGHLYINVEGIDTTAYVELLNGSDAPVRKAKVKNGGVLFMDLKPDKYYARLVVDLNDNGKWDTGNYADKRQPEEVFYSPVQYNVLQNWQVEETWNVKATPWAKQKPIEITKNKPKEATKKKRNYKDEGQQKSSSRNSGMGGSMGMPF